MNLLKQTYRRVLHRYDNLGVRGLLGLRRMKRHPARPYAPHPFDVAHGTQTGGFEPGESIVTGSPADLYNTAYYAISPSSLTAALEQIPAALDGYTFVDLGCGKGRALLVAAAYPFTRLVGVELSSSLCGAGRRNVAADPRITVVNHDAATFLYPESPLVVFLYHPFLQPVLRAALANLERQLRAKPRPLWLLYANPSYAKLLARSNFLEQVWDRNLPLSAEDSDADRHGIAHEQYTLYQSVISSPPKA